MEKAEVVAHSRKNFDWVELSRKHFISTKHWKDRLFRKFSFEVVTIVLAPSGAGKSTFIDQVEHFNIPGGISNLMPHSSSSTEWITLSLLDLVDDKFKVADVLQGGSKKNLFVHIDLDGYPERRQVAEPKIVQLSKLGKRVVFVVIDPSREQLRLSAIHRLKKKRDRLSRLAASVFSSDRDKPKQVARFGKLLGRIGVDLDRSLENPWIARDPEEMLATIKMLKHQTQPQLEVWITAKDYFDKLRLLSGVRRQEGNY